MVTGVRGAAGAGGRTGDGDAAATPATSIEGVRALVAGVPDPELPMLTIDDLGVLRDVRVCDATVVVSLTPTYSGCPALEMMRWEVRRRLADAGFGDVRIATVLDPPWSSDWITAEGRRKLAEAGIAPPGPAPRGAGGPVPVTLSRRPPDVTCPRCGSRDTVETSAFGSTACKSLRRCRACAEPFEHVKEI